MPVTDTHKSIEAVWKIEQAKLIAVLTRIVRDVAIAEDLAQDVLVAALEQWPGEGIPNNPGAWLMTAAKRRAIDHLRRGKMIDRKHAELEVRDVDPDVDQDQHPIADDMLRLMFTACHPVLTPEARVALTLRLLGGLTTTEIARAFLIPESTVAQRIVRAKRTLAEKQIPFEVPGAAEMPQRLASVASVIYLIFNEGYAASSGEDWLRPALCEDALRLGRILAELAPREPEVHGLVALMELQASRNAARLGPNGEPVLLLDQNRARWDQLLIRRGLNALDRALKLSEPGLFGPYTLQAAIAACHARARTADETDWAQIARLYGMLAQVSPSPVIELNRAMAVSMARGPAAGLEIVDALIAAGSLDGYHRLPAARADLLYRLARYDEARAEFERAASMTENIRERDLLLERARSCHGVRNE